MWKWLAIRNVEGGAESNFCVDRSYFSCFALIFLRLHQMQLNCSPQNFSFSIFLVIMKLHDKRKNLLSSKAQ